MVTLFLVRACNNEDSCEHLRMEANWSQNKSIEINPEVGIDMIGDILITAIGYLAQDGEDNLVENTRIFNLCEPDIMTAWVLQNFPCSFLQTP